MGVVMVFEPNFKKVKSSVRRHIGTTQSIVEVKLPTNDAELREIYSVGAKADIVSSEIGGKTINFIGLVDFQAIYQGGELSSLDYTAEFKDKFDVQEDLVGELIVSSSVVEVNSNIVNSDIRATAIVEVSIDIIETSEYNVLVDIDALGAYKSTKEINYSTYLGKAVEKFDVASDIDILGAKSIYMVIPCVRLNSVLPKDNYIEATGVLGLDICYSTSDELSGLKSTYREEPFTWELAYDGLEDSNHIATALSIISNEIKVTSTPTEDGMNVSMSVPVELRGFVFENNTLSVVDDVYLESNYLSITSEAMPSIVNFGVASFKDNIAGSAEVTENAPFIDEILSVSTNNIVLARNYIEEDRLVVEGVATATVVYYTKETSSATSLQIEMPFAVEEKVGAMESGIVTLCLSDISAKSRRGKEIEVSGELCVYADTYNYNESMVISSVTLGEEKAQDDCSLYIYIVKPNETIWDIAKEMNVSSELIMEQNPGLELPLEAGQKLVIYKSRVMEF